MSLTARLGSNLSRKLTLIVVLISVVGLSAVVLVISNQVASTTRDDARDYAAQVAETTAEGIAAQLDGALEVATTLGRAAGALVESGETSRAALDNVQRSVLDAHPGLLGVYLAFEPNALDGRDADFVDAIGSDETGRYVPYWNRGSGEIAVEALLDYTVPGVGDYYVVPVTTGKTVILEPYVYPVGGKDIMMTSLVVPLQVNGEIVGIAGVDIALDTLQQSISALRPMGTGRVALLSQAGQFVAYDSGDVLGTPAIETEPGFEASTTATPGEPSVWTGSVRSVGGAATSVAVSVSVGDTGSNWTVVVSIPEGTILASLSDLQTVMIVIATIVALLIGLGCWFAVRRWLGGPLGGVTRSVEAIAAGSLDQPVRDTERRDEIGQLARAIDHYREARRTEVRLREEHASMEAEQARLRSEQTRLAEEQVQMLADRHEASLAAELDRERTMQTVADQFSEAIGSIAGLVSSESFRLRERAGELHRTTGSTSQEAALVSDVASVASADVQHVVHAAQQLASSAKSIGQQIELSRHTTLRAVDEANAMHQEFRRLEESARHIGDVVELIKQVASQTNLLALNATIEAARAGEAGKGFAVVAGEVRELAGQTANATTEIARQIADVQGATTRSMTAITAIGNTIGAISDATLAIADAVEEQVAATDEITSSVRSAAEGTDRVSATMSIVVEATSAAGRSADDLLTVAASLAEHGEQLERQAAQFVGRLTSL